MSERPKSVKSITYRAKTFCGELFITITFDDQLKPFEVFLTYGKAGGCTSAVVNGIAVLCSYSLRAGLDPRMIVKAFNGIKCHGSHRNTCLNEIAKVLNLHLNKTAVKLKELKQVQHEAHKA